MMSAMITIVDYGMGNLRSVQKGFERVGSEARITSESSAIGAATKLVLPGVGAFGDAMTGLRERGLIEPICEYVASGRPFLGICLGLQLLFDRSHEDGIFPGLGIIPGEVVRFRDREGLKVPHMGWNQLRIRRPSTVLDGVEDGSFVYFVHSYYAVPAESSVTTAETDYPDAFTSIVSRDNIFATQFHPEKSQQVGLRLLRNFASL
jgi:glutamine amidotransferase